MVGAIGSQSTAVQASGRPTEAQLANKGLALFLENGAFIQGISDELGKRDLPTQASLTKSLWASINPAGLKFVDKRDLKEAVSKLGGTPEMADALWNKLNSDKNKSLTVEEFTANQYLNDAVKGTLPKFREAIEDLRVTLESQKEANTALVLFLEDKDFLAGQVQQSAKLVPTTRGKILASLWGTVNPNKALTIGRREIEEAVLKQGGSSAQAEALWQQLKPESGNTITVGDFATNDYLVSYFKANLPKVQEAIEKQRTEQDFSPVGSNSILDSFFRKDGSGTILDFFI